VIVLLACQQKEPCVFTQRGAELIYNSCQSSSASSASSPVSSMTSWSSCASSGGPCDHEIKGNTKEEWLTNGMAHIKEFHPEMLADIEAMTPEESKKWAEDNLDKVWDETPEEPEDHDTKEVFMM
jgi:predicted small metal-binding protein